MKRYRNASGDSGISAYEYGPDWIRIRFVGGDTYMYTSDEIGKTNLATMKKLADSGRGLTTFINTHPSIKNGYSRRVT